ncbi:MAG: leucine-rich repeat protein [Oscillospiraceae bacterium]|nr:leucine-rich repeat protein [Oscillospiraceae bacterium]
MSTFVSTRDLVGESALEASIIDGSYRNYTEYKDDLLTSIGRSSFYNCAKLVVADFPSLSGSIAMEAFHSCKVLTALILRNNRIVSLAATSAFQSTPIASGTGYIYAPSALIDSYKAATQWATYADQFRALEDYTVDGTVDGDLDENKI